jgi:hypothetical protein
LSLQICPSVCPLDHIDAMAAVTAALSFVIPLANAARRPPLARSSQAVDFRRDLALTQF